VIRAVEDDPYDVKMENQIRHVKESSKVKTMNDLLKSGNIWKV
jgi:hypothetical protein